MKTLYALVLFCCLQTLGAAQETRTYVAHATYSASGAQVYKDPMSGTLIYIETDGRPPCGHFSSREVAVG